MEQEQKGHNEHYIFLTLSLFLILAPFGAEIMYNKQKEGKALSLPLSRYICAVTMKPS